MFNGADAGLALVANIENADDPHILDGGGECQASCRLSYVMISPIGDAAALAA